MMKFGENIHDKDSEMIRDRSYRKYSDTETYQAVALVSAMIVNPEDPEGPLIPDPENAMISTDAEDITPDDNTSFKAIAFKSLSDGTIKVDTLSGETRTIQVYEGLLEPIKITKFYATGSTVASIRIYKA